MDISFEDLEKNYLNEESENEKKFVELINISKSDRIRLMTSWETAYYYNEVINHPLFNSHFKDIDEFADLVETSSTTVYKSSSAVDFDKIHHFDHSKISVSNVYTLSRTGQDYEMFCEFLASTGIEPESATQKQLRDYIAIFYGKKEPDAEIEYEGSLYRIPIKVLKKYLVTGDNTYDLSWLKKEIRPGYISYLWKKDPGKSISTYAMYASDSNYLINNGKEKEFIRFVKTKDDMPEIKDMIRDMLIEKRGEEKVTDGGKYYYEKLCWLREYIHSLGGLDSIFNPYGDSDL